MPVNSRDRASHGPLSYLILTILVGLIAGVAVVLPRSKAAQRSPPAPERARPPNVVLIVMDTTRADRCGFNGYARGTTPHLERFARDAVTFTRAWSPAPWTPPAHASLFTGLRPEHHGLMSGTRAYLTAEHVVLAEHLQRKGYATAAFVNNPLVNPGSGLLQGFDHVELLYKEEKGVPPTAAAAHERALSWLDGGQADGSPFLLFFSHMEPHDPYQPPQEFRDRFVQGDPSASERARAAAFGGRLVADVNFGILKLTPSFRQLLSDLYDGEIASLDRQIGSLLDTLERRGLLENTLVIVTSDHGENLGDHGLMGHMFSLHRSLLHVPLLLRLPGRFEGGKRVEDVVRLEDVLPTILEACGARTDEALDGKSLTGELSGRIAIGRLARPRHILDAARGSIPDAQIAPFDRGLWSAFDGRHHLIRASDGDTQLFDLHDSLGETSNRANELPDVVQRLSRLIDRP